MPTMTIPIKIEIAQWWYDIRKPLIELQLEFGVIPDIKRETQILREATTYKFMSVSR